MLLDKPVLFSKMMVLEITQKTPYIKELKATRGVTKYPLAAISEVDKTSSMGLESNDKPNADGIAMAKKYFNE